MPILQLTKYKSGLTDEEVARLMNERAPRFREIAGLLQKYYFKDEATGEFGAVYVWESEAAMLEFRRTDLAQGMNAAYKIEGEKHVEVLAVKLVLRD
jgi:heme-degrading monooxygenase HmoA